MICSNRTGLYYDRKVKMSQIETTLSKCNVLTFSRPKSVIDIWTSSCLISEGTAFSSGKPLGQKYFDSLSQGRKWRVRAGEGTAVDFCLSRSAQSYSVHLRGCGTGMELGMGHEQPGTPSYRITESHWPLCSSLCWGTNPDSNPEILWD